MTDAATSENPPGKPVRAKRTGTATYTTDEVSALVGVSKRHLQRMAQANEVPGRMRLGARVLFSKERIDRWLAGE